MALQKQKISLRFGKLDTSTEAKFLGPGQVVSAVNVYQPQSGRYEKRKGYSALSTTTDTGTISTGEGLGTLGGSLLLRTSDAVYQRSSSEAKWIYKGGLVPVSPRRSLVIPNGGGRPAMVVTSTRVWTFCISAAENSVYYTVQALDGTAIVGPTLASGVSGTNLRSLQAVEASDGNIWLFWCYEDVALSVYSQTIKVAKFSTSSPSSSPTVYTYWAPGAGYDIGSFDVLKNSSNQVVFAATGDFTGIGVGIATSVLNTSTGGPTSGTVLHVSGGTDIHYPGLWVSGADGSGGYIMYAASRTSSGNTFRVWRLDADGAALQATYLTGTFTAADRSKIAMAAWTTSSTDVKILSSYAPAVNSVGWSANAVEDAVIYLNGVTGGVADTESRLCRAQWVASRAFKHSSSWYFIAGHDDGDARLQCSYTIRRADTGTIVGRFLYGLGGETYNLNGLRQQGAVWAYGGVLPVNVSTNTVRLPAGGYLGGAVDYGTYLATIDMDPTLGPLAAALDGNTSVIATGWPAQVPAAGQVQELCPPMYPRTVSLAAGGATGDLSDGTYQACAVYAFRDAAGRVWRSSPCPAVSITLSGGTNTQSINITADYLRTVNTSNNVFVELYFTERSGTLLKLWKRVDNSHNGSSDSVTVNYGSSDEPLGEAIYTNGGVLENIPPPPCKTATQWRNRLWLADTEDGSVWFSDEYQDGIGPGFNELQRVQFQEGSGQSRALGVVDYNYLAVFKEDAIYVVSGQGPDNTGSGNYVPLQLPGRLGCTNPRSVVTTDQGCMFQGTDGLIWLIDRGLQVQPVGLPVESYSSSTVTGAVHVPFDRQARFFAGSTCLVWDYEHGQWYEWNAGIMLSEAAAVLSGTQYMVSSTGVVYQQQTGTYLDGATAIQHSLSLAPLSFADIQGFGRVSRGLILGTYYSAADVRVTASTDYESPEQATETFDKSVSGGPFQFDFRPARGKSQAIQITIAQNGNATGRAFSIEGVAFEIMVKPGLKRVPGARRIT